MAIVLRDCFCHNAEVLQSCQLPLFPILMRQFGIDIALFVLFAIGGLICVGLTAQLHPKLENRVFAKPSSYGHTYLRISDFIETSASNDFDILHLGSSTCYRGIDPAPFATLGHPSFNLCSSSQSFFNSRYLLEWSQQLNSQIRTITVDVYPALWSSSGTESCRDLTVNHDHTGQSIFQKMAWATGDPFNAVLAAYFGVKRTFFPLTGLPEQQDEYKKGGFTFSKRNPIGALTCDTLTAHLCATQERALCSMKKTCEEQGIQLILINPPQLCEARFEKPPVMQGIPWVEGNNWPLAKVDSLYYDDHHLRGVGAKLYSEWLAHQVNLLLN